MKKILHSLIFASLVLFTSASIAIASRSEIGLNDIDNWCINAMSRWHPIKDQDTRKSPESEDEAKARYGLIARAASKVAFDPNEKPLFSGHQARSRTLALLLATASAESGFRKDVDFGTGRKSRGDSGKSWCLMQIRLSVKNRQTGRTKRRIVIEDGDWRYSIDGVTGWGGEDLVRDREKCFRAGLYILRTTMKACSSLPKRERLAGYIGKSCDSIPGRERSVPRMNMFAKFLFQSPPIAPDPVISDLLHPKIGTPDDVAPQYKLASSVD